MLDDDEQNIFLVKISPSFWTSKLSLAGRRNRERLLTASDYLTTLFCCCDVVVNLLLAAV